MVELIKLKEYPVRDFLKKLLQDKTTKMNIKFATSTYECYGYSEESQMTEGALLGFSSCDIQPRVYKSLEDQGDRTRKKAEVFTPAWVVNRMNNHCDTEWFEKSHVFNTEYETAWGTTKEKIDFPEDKSWKDYIDSRRLEITCGEAPYIVSRYDTTTGEIIPVKERIGILDRKLRIVNENAADEKEWLTWAIRAFQSVYGYEFQGDNLLIARINLLMTFCDYLKEIWNREATKSELTKIINIICWNFWQMDGLEKVIPFGKPREEFPQLSLFGDDEPEEDEIEEECLIYDWRHNHSKLFKDIEKRGNSMKFDFVIGNPPYQDNTKGDNETYAPPVYHLFMDAAYAVADKVELIHPARFLFNAGSTPKEWNRKMLHDKNFKILLYEEDCKKIFANTEIKGGIAISYRDSSTIFGEIGTFAQYSALNSILKKVKSHVDFVEFSNVVVTRTAYRLTKKMHEDHPEAISQLSDGHAYDMSSNIFERLPQIFFDTKPIDGNDYISILGRINNSRIYKFVRRDYVNNVENLDKYKVFMPGANGNGTFGEIISSPMVIEPTIGSTETFISIGSYDNIDEAQNTLKYIKTKFSRALLNILKATQANTPEKWKCVPIQDFTADSDIDWSVSVAEIDKQLYKKYGLSAEEIEFIETHVKEME